jgi:hypothetical protein
MVSGRERDRVRDGRVGEWGGRDKRVRDGEWKRMG